MFWKITYMLCATVYTAGFVALVFFGWQPSAHLVGAVAFIGASAAFVALSKHE